jgi:hypothetical protein
MTPEPRILGTRTVISRRRFMRTVGAVAATAALAPVVASAQAPAPGKAAAPGQKGMEHGGGVPAVLLYENSSGNIQVLTHQSPECRSHIR